MPVHATLSTRALAASTAALLMPGGHHSNVRVPLGAPWDTQKDMAMAWIGAMLAQRLLARWHDRPMAALGAAP